MLDYKVILNRPIYSIQEGKNCGKLQDMAIDFSAHRVLGIVSKLDGDIPKELIPIDSVVNFGTDAMMIQSADQVKSTDSDEPLAQAIKKWIKWIDLQVIKDGGEQVGTLSNFVFDDKSGEIFSYEISGGISPKFMEGSVNLPKEVVVSISSDCMVIKQDTEVVVKEAKGSRKIFLGAIDEIKEDWDKVSSVAAEKIKGVKDKIMSGRDKKKPPKQQEPPHDN